MPTEADGEQPSATANSNTPGELYTSISHRLEVDHAGAIALSVTIVLLILVCIGVTHLASFTPVFSACIFSLLIGGIIACRHFNLLRFVIKAILKTSRYFTSATAIAFLSGIFCTGLAITLWINEIRRDSQYEFVQISARLIDEIDSRFQIALHTLKSTRGLFVTHDKVEASEFDAFFGSINLASELPGVTGIGFAEFCPNQGAVKLQQSLCTIKYFQPTTSDHLAIGSEFFTDCVCQDAIKRSVATGGPILSGRLPLLINGKPRAGCLLLFAVGEGESVPLKSNISQCRSNGVVIAPLVIENVFRSVANATNGDLDFEIFDGVQVTKSALLFDLDNHLTSTPGAIDISNYSRRMSVTSSQIQVGGQIWTIVASTTPKFESRVSFAAPIGFGIGGFVASVLLSGFIWSLEASRIRAVGTAIELKAERTNANMLASEVVREMDDLRRTLDQHAIISVADSSGKITSVNNAFCQISGYSRDELLGQNHRILNSGKHSDKFWVDVWRAIANGQSWRGEICNRTKSGALYWVDSIITPFVGANGSIEKFVSIRHDVTERKRAEEQARASEQFLRNAIDSLDSHTVILDGEGRIRYVNRAWRDFAQANRGGDKVFEEADYLSVCDVAATKCPEAAMVADAIRAVLGGDAEPPQIEYTCHAPKQRRWFICSIRGFCCGSERFAVVSHLDITAIKDAETRLQATNAELVVAKQIAESANRSKSEFLANMSHEIRTPLTAMLGFADILREDGDIRLAPEQRLCTIDTIKNAGQHLLAIINDILDLSKIEADKMTVEKIETPFVAVLRDVTALLHPTAAGKGVVLRTSFTTAIPVRIMSDPTRLRQILMNMVGNAVKFTESGEIDVRVGLHFRDGSQRLEINIEDTGPGMTEEQAQRLFQSFGQADTSVTRRFGGAGLGLAISRRLARLMGGSVSLISTKLGSGSKFRIELPLESVPGSCWIQSLDEVQQEARREAPCDALPKLSGRLILAEDGPDNQRLIAFHLRKAGASVDVAENGRIAFDMIESEAARGTPYDMLLTDIQMPDMDGHTLTRKLRERNCQMSIVALTAHAMEEERQKCFASGCNDFATKPIDKFALLAVCAKWLNAHTENLPSFA